MRVTGKQTSTVTVEITERQALEALRKSFFARIGIQEDAQVKGAFWQQWRDFDPYAGGEHLIIREASPDEIQCFEALEALNQSRFFKKP
jgi:hypothetical protein